MTDLNLTPGRSYVLHLTHRHGTSYAPRYDDAVYLGSDPEHPSHELFWWREHDVHLSIHESRIESTTELGERDERQEHGRAAI